MDEDAGYWEREFEHWLEPFMDALGHKKQRKWAPVYIRGLLGPGERKSIEPMAERVAPDDGEQLHHFLCTSCWDPAPLERVLAEKAQRMVGGPDAVLIIDDTTLLKQGKHSVGVARQYSGAAGKRANCQALVSLTLAQREVPVCVALRLFLPEEWTADPARLAETGVPEEHHAYRTKGKIAIGELDRVREAGVTFGVVTADAGYGTSAKFRHALSARGLTWAVGIPRTQKVYPADVELHMPATKPGVTPGGKIGGRPRKHPVATHTSEAADVVLARAKWRSTSWRTRTKGPLRARFAAVRVVVADGPETSSGQHLPGDEAWLVGEWRSNDERKYYLTNHPGDATLKTLAAAIKARWSCEQAHQQMKEELGLDHFEGRSWTGLHHHALMTMISFAFVQHLRIDLRLTEVRGRGKNTAPNGTFSNGKHSNCDVSRRPTTEADAPGNSTHADRHAAHKTRSLTTSRRTTMSEMPRTLEV